MLDLMRHKPSSALTAVSAAAVLLTGCSTAEPAVCESLDAVRNSVDTVSQAKLGENGLSVLAGGLTQLKADLGQFAADAKAQFQPQTDALRTSVDQLSSSVATAKADPSATTLGGVGVAVSAVQTAAVDLDAAASKTC